METCWNCKLGDRRGKVMGGFKAVACDGSHVPVAHECHHPGRFQRHDPIVITPRKKDLQGRLF